MQAWGKQRLIVVVQLLGQLHPLISYVRMNNRAVKTSHDERPGSRCSDGPS
jgi:hypothetical protein